MEKKSSTEEYNQQHGEVSHQKHQPVLEQKDVCKKSPAIQGKDSKTNDYLCRCRKNNVRIPFLQDSSSRDVGRLQSPHNWIRDLIEDRRVDHNGVSV